MDKETKGHNPTRREANGVPEKLPTGVNLCHQSEVEKASDFARMVYNLQRTPPDNSDKSKW